MSNLGSRHLGFLLSVCIVKMDLELKFRDVLECSWGNLDHIWTCQIWGSRHLGFFPKGLACDFGSKFYFFLSVCMVKLDLEMKFGDVLECSWGNLDHIWTCEIQDGGLMLSWGTPQGLVTLACVLSLTKVFKKPTWDSFFLLFLFWRTQRFYNIYIEVKIYTILCTGILTINNV